MLSRLRSVYSTTPDPQLPSDPLDALKLLVEREAQDPVHSKFLTETTLKRYLTARNNDPVKAFKQLNQTLSWRVSYKPFSLYQLYKQSLHHEAQSGKMYVLPAVDANGRAVIIMRPGLENSADGQGNIRYLVYTLERAAYMSEQSGDGKFIVIVDYFTGKISTATSPSLSTMKQTTHILQTHYPERLGGMLFYDAPSFFFALFKMIRPFIDPVTREKLRFVKRGQTVDAPFLDWQAIPAEYGGQLEHSFEVEKYFEYEQQPK
ncbi:cral-trio domain containing protein [Gracilaria domingensis]|nr:cral-trio domain containing protein [Gracilaria domingensis]